MGIVSLERRRASAGTFARVERGASLTASGASLNLRSKTEARRVRQLRQGWQQDAWAYRDTIGEIRYAVDFKAHCASRMRLFPAIYPNGRWDEAPVPMVDPSEGPTTQIPADAIESAQNALNQLGTGREAIAEMLSSLSSNFSVCGEAYFVGQQNASTGMEEWSVRSVDELMVRDDQYALREVPLDPQGVFGWVELDPDTDYVSRVWNGHPRFRLLPDSPMRAILDDCESLLILRRTIRATGRSRLAGAGLLLLPEGLEVETSVEDNEDAEAQPFLGKLGEAMMQPIGDEGTAAAVVPILIRGSSDALKEVRQIFLDRRLDPEMAAQRTELVGVIATGFDLPKEVIVGMADLNHWTAWQVDDNTFRHHVEPHVVDLMTAITVGYLRVSMIADGIDPAIVAKSLVWYDPTELLTHPDRTADAISLYNLKELSGAALREVTGFTEKDRPDPLEIVQRAVGATHTWPVNALLAILGRLDPTLTIPSIETAGTIPGLKGGVAIGVPLPAVAPPKGPAGDSTVPVGPEPAAPDSSTPAGPPASTPPSDTTLGLWAGAAAPRLPVAPEYARMSRKLADIDSSLRGRLQVAANAAMSRVLDRAGAKLRTKVNQSRSPEAIPFKSLLRPAPNAAAVSIVGETVTASLGLTTTDLVATDWADVRAVFEKWVSEAQAAALKTAVRLARISPEDPRVGACAARQLEARKSAWAAFSAALTKRASELLYDPHPAADPAAPWASANPDILVTPGMVRAAIAMAGGHPHVPPALSAGIDGDPPPGGIGTGDDISSLLSDSGANATLYEWVHGSPVVPFEPHEALDGYQFSSWDDPGLANPGDWPDAYFAPGDHAGCFPAGTLVSGPPARGATLRYWQGEMVELGFASGELLPATPNHPVLTSHGWVAAGELGEGDDVVRCSGAQGIAPLVPDRYQVPARIEEVADAFRVASGVATMRVEVAPEDFHGDGAGSKVAVVRTDRHLGRGEHAPLGEPLHQATLAGAHPVLGVGLAADGGPTARFEGIGPAPLGSVGSGGVGAVLLGREGRLEEGACLSDRAHSDAGTPQAHVDAPAADAEAIGERLDGLTGLVSLDQVIEVKRYRFAGHVYNLSTEPGWYLANGIVVHNCTCDYQILWEPSGEGEATATALDGLGTGVGVPSAEQMRNPAEGDRTPRLPYQPSHELADVPNAFRPLPGEGPEPPPAMWPTGPSRPFGPEDRGGAGVGTRTTSKPDVTRGDAGAPRGGLGDMSLASETDPFGLGVQREAQMNALPRDLQEMVDGYGSNYAYLMNNALRFLDGDMTAIRQADEERAALIDKMDAAFNASSTTTNGATLYRGIENRLQSDASDKYMAKLTSASPGDVLTEPGYLSTSLARSEASRRGGWLMEIATGANQRAVIGTLREAEVILPRGRQLVVDSVDKESKVVTVHVV